MIVQPNMHLGFNCQNLEKSIEWYKKFLNCREKFTLYWGDLIPGKEEMRAKISADTFAELQRRKKEKWIVYLEFADCPGSFIELFNEPTAHEVHIPDQKRDLNYTHFAHVVDDVGKFYKEVIQKGGASYVWVKPQLNIDRTKAMWLQDPDGNRMEFIEYTPYSMQRIGKELPVGVDFFGLHDGNQ